MKLLKLSVIASAVLLSTGCASTGNIFSKVTNSVTSVVAPSEDEYVEEEPQLWLLPSKTKIYNTKFRFITWNRTWRVV